MPGLRAGVTVIDVRMAHMSQESLPVVNDGLWIRQELCNVGRSKVKRHTAGHKGVIQLLGHIISCNAVFLQQKMNNSAKSGVLDLRYDVRFPKLWPLPHRLGPNTMETWCLSLGGRRSKWL